MLKGEQRPRRGHRARPPYFVSETKKVSRAAARVSERALQVAVVVDEYGGTAGIITIEDIIEEIVGDIADEHEEEEATIVDLGDEHYLVSGLLRVEALEEMLDADLRRRRLRDRGRPDLHHLGRIPTSARS